MYNWNSKFDQKILEKQAPTNINSSSKKNIESTRELYNTISPNPASLNILGPNSNMVRPFATYINKIFF